MHDIWPAAVPFLNLFAARVVKFGKHICNSREDSHCGVLGNDTMHCCGQICITQTNRLPLSSGCEWGESSARFDRQGDKEDGYPVQWDGDRRKLLDIMGNI
jgi:hypothetical protein